MNRSKYNNDIYSMYEEECSKNEVLTKKLKYTKLENDNLKYEFNYQNENFEQKIELEVKKALAPLMKENAVLKEELNKTYNEINRLKSQISSNDTIDEKDYQIDKLTNQVNKNSTNSGIPTSKEIRKHKTSPNTYDHRKNSTKLTGGQVGHKGETLTNEKLNKNRYN